MIELILGGARSGKSRLAEHLALQSGLPVTYVATAQAGDGEMSTRILQHRERRPEHWGLVEEPLALAEVLERLAAPQHCVLVDCLTLWVTNLLIHEDGWRLRGEIDALLETLPQLPGESSWSATKPGWGWCRWANSAADMSTRPAGCTSPWPRSASAWCSPSPACPWC